MKPGQEIYVRLPTEAEDRVLHTSLCLEWDEEKAVVSINDDELGLEAGQDLLIYFTEKTKFLQMAVRITHANHEGQSLLLELKRQSNPISADGRETFRITTLTAGIDARVEGNDPCALRDISMVGFAIVTSETYQMGQSLSVIVERGENARYEGRACVHSIRKLRKNHIRYGFRAMPDKGAWNLEEGLASLTSQVQSDQLRRVT